MRGYLLDTHVVLWWLREPEFLSEPALDVISNSENRVFVSAAAVWELAIKKSIGRLDMPSNLPEVLAADDIETLDVDIHHALAVADLPFLHRDPFDRIQIAQVLKEDLVFVTRDQLVQQYEVPLLHA